MNSRGILSLTLGLLLASPGAALASAPDNGRLVGKVVRQDGAGLPGVSVHLSSLEHAALTDASGGFSFGGLPPGTYSLRFTLVDHADTQEAQVAPGETTVVTKVVDWEVPFADTITVTSASRRPERITEAPAAVTLILGSEIERAAANGQAPKLLEFTAGVDFTQSGLYDFNFSTRGLNSSLNRRVLTLIDGRDPSTAFLGAQEWAAISFPLDELESVELVRGPGSALYGANAFTGVLNLTTRAPRDSQGGRFRLTAGELDTRRAELRFATELGSGFYGRLVGGYQTSGDFTASRRLGAEYLPCQAGRTRDCLQREGVDPRRRENEIAFGGARIDKYIGEAMLLTVEGGTAALAGPVSVTGVGRVQMTDVKRPWSRLNFSSLRWNFLAYHDSREADEQFGLPSGALVFEDSSTSHGELQGNLAFADGKGILVGGAAWREQKMDSVDREGVQTTIAEARSDHSEAVFGQVEHGFGDRLKAVVAARFDQSTLHDSRVSPKGSLVWSGRPGHTFRLSYNEAFQVPNYAELFLQTRTVLPGTALSALNLSSLEAALAPALRGVPLGFSEIPVLALGNRDLEVEKIRSYEVGYHGVLGLRTHLMIDAHRSEIEDFVTDLLPNVGPWGRANPAFGPYAPPSSLPEPLRAQILAILRTNPATAPIFPFLSNLPNGQPVVALASYRNAGRVETRGIDLALEASLADRWRAGFGYSWLDFEVRERVLGDVLLPNAPEHKFNADLSYTGDRLGAAIKYRWVDGFPWAAGLYSGPVPSYDVVDLSATYRIGSRCEVGLDVSNLLDSEHWQAFGGDLLRRRALGHVTFNW